MEWLESGVEWDGDGFQLENNSDNYKNCSYFKNCS